MSRVRIAMASRISALFALMGMVLFVRSAASARGTVSRSNSVMASLGFINSSCKITRYPDVCVASLLPYKGSFRATQGELVKVAVNVSLLRARNDSAWALTLSKTKSPSKRESVALKDCVENFADTSDQIKSSLAELMHLKNDTFKSQISDVQTWMSAALTNDDSCLDGFQKVRGSLKPLISCRVQKSSKVFSNALAFVNNFAASKGYSVAIAL